MAAKLKKLEVEEQTQSAVTDLSNDPTVAIPPCLVVLFGPNHQVGQQWSLLKPNSVVGRASASDISINDPSLSKSHARITIEGAKAFITDLGATNKTRINETPVPSLQPQLLTNNDHIRMGNLVFKFLQKGLVSETNDKARMENELEQMRSAQSSLFPTPQEARHQNVKIGGRYRTASELGGDWWWHWSNENRVFALIADAEGHGAGSALITSAARATVTTMEDNPKVTLEEVYTTLSRAIRKSSQGGIAMSAFLVEYTFATGKIRYINASHSPAAVWLPPQASITDWKKLNLLTEGISPALGLARMDYTVGLSDAVRGSRLVLLTDGLSERPKSPGVPPTDREFLKILIACHVENGDNQSGFLDELLIQSDALSRAEPLTDDITVVALDFF